MTAKELGDMPAYPRQQGCPWPGLTKLEAFTMAAMQALISNADAGEFICNNDDRYKEQPDGRYNFSEVVALNAIGVARACLAELAKEV